MGRRSVRLNADEMEKFFEAGADLPVMGVTPDQLVSLKTTTIVILGDDNTPFIRERSDRTPDDPGLRDARSRARRRGYCIDTLSGLGAF